MFDTAPLSDRASTSLSDPSVHPIKNKGLGDRIAPVVSTPLNHRSNPLTPTRMNHWRE